MTFETPKIHSNSSLHPPTEPLRQVELDFLCKALSNITLNHQPFKGEYIEDDDTTEEKKISTKTEPTTTVHVPAVREPAPPPIDSKPPSDPLAAPKTADEEAVFNQEQLYNILAPDYRTMDEPWSKQTTTEPRITLAAMFKTNSNRFREDSLAQQCSRTSCQFRKHCYWEREWEQRQGRVMYHYTQCVQHQDPPPACLCNVTNELRNQSKKK